MSTTTAGTAGQADLDAAGDGSRRRSLLIVLGVVFLDLVGFGIVVPILPFYVRSFGVSDVFIGLVAATYSLTQFLAAPVLGRLSDERGRRPVLMATLAGSAVAWVLFGLGEQVGAAFGTAGALAALFLARGLSGAMGGNIATAQAYVADITPVEDRARALGLVGATFSLGFIFGPAMGAAVASDAAVAVARDVLPAFVPATPFSLPSFLAALMSLAALVAAGLFLPEPNRSRGRARGSGIVGQFRAALADAALRPLVVVFFVVSVAFSGVTVAFIPFVADVYGYDAAQAGLLLTYVGVVGALNQGVLVGVLSRRLPDHRIAVVGAGLLTVAALLFPFSPVVGRALLPAVGAVGPELLALLAVLTLLPTGNGLLSVGTTAMVSRAASEEGQGSAFGVTQGAGSLGRTVGPPVMTGVYVLAVWAPFVLCGVLVAGVTAALVVVTRERTADTATGP